MLELLLLILEVCKPKFMAIKCPSCSGISTDFTIGGPIIRDTTQIFIQGASIVS